MANNAQKLNTKHYLIKLHTRYGGTKSSLNSPKNYFQLFLYRNRVTLKVLSL